MKKINLIGLVLLSVSFCISCVTTTAIGLNRDFHKGQFTIGKTTKNDVVNFLGLPQKMENKENGTVQFIYDGEAVLTGMSTGSGAGGPGLIQALMNDSDVSRRAKYTFSNKGVLMKKVEPKIINDEDLN